MTNHNTPSSRGWEEIRVSVALSALAALAVLLRNLARWRRRLNPEIDDWMALASLVFIGAMLAEEILWVTIGGSGKHIWELPPDQIQSFFKIFLSNMFTYSITTPLVKLSLIFFYRRIFISKGFRMMADGLIAMSILWGVATFLSSALICRPLQKFWDVSIPGKCFDSLKFVLGVQGVNIFLDATILVLPMKAVWSLHRPWQERLALSGVFLLGGFVVFASVYRILTLLMISNDDITYTTFHGAIWTFVEPCIGLVCSCLPTIRSLFPAYRSGNTGKSSGSHNNSSSRQDLDLYSPRQNYLKMDNFCNEIRAADSGYDTEGSPRGITVKRTVEVV